MTASRALNNQRGVSATTRDTILKVAAEMGYVTNRIAQKLSSGQSRVIGVLASDLDTPFVAALVTGVVRAASLAGNEVLVYLLGDVEKRPGGSVLQLLQQFTDGIVALLPYECGFVQALGKAHVPVITIDHPSQHGEYPSVSADSYSGARQAMDHLAALGHKRIAFVSGAEQLESARQRHRAYLDAVAVLGLARGPALLVKGDYTTHGGRGAAERLLALKKRPTAVFAANDQSAFGVMALLQERGVSIPEDISVVGFDDVPAASEMHPALTTVRQPIDELGRAAINALLARVAGLDAAATHMTLPTELIVRKSTAPPPG